MFFKFPISKMKLRYFKELLRPVQFLAIFRHFRQFQRYQKSHVMLGFYSTLRKVELGEKVYIGNNCTIFNAQIGCHSYCNDNTHIQNATIGKYSSIGAEVYIGIGSHPTNLVSTHPAFYSNNKAFETYSDDMYFEEYRKCMIGNDVWIGSRCTILNNIMIGDGAIVAYGAVVTKNVLPYSIVGGVPAKHIKFRFDEVVVNELLNIKWWELRDEFFRKNYKLFHNPLDFIKFYQLNSDYVESFRKK